MGESDAVPEYTTAGHKVVPAPELKREVDTGEVWVEVCGLVVPELDPALRERFDAMDAAAAGMTQDEILAALGAPGGGWDLIRPAAPRPAAGRDGS